MKSGPWHYFTLWKIWRCPSVIKQKDPKARHRLWRTGFYCQKVGWVEISLRERVQSEYQLALQMSRHSWKQRRLRWVCVKKLVTAGWWAKVSCCGILQKPQVCHLLQLLYNKPVPKREREKHKGEWPRTGPSNFWKEKLLLCTYYTFLEIYKHYE